ncbi:MULTISPECIES: hypothetical protein [unclassified Solwaraspora]|uniref:hypothetical protein n=1 Tax=unclassified Solwaraspora TaxID=2627926 RepID=UPI00248AC986|nr:MULTISPECIES: hypothetical protein [unclassified Solwaraspora]WBB99915.1 hypothetical protein O7553_14005 [Solwaraspora sp. WMMA2059]WBC21537.1 hypothetical protein O7543_03365 [Solwaraspora sp. WMMA2080]WJK36426.1 hypothetical protein O7610_08765 [Solwaraspora sp. WMMA2065]
MLVGSALSLQLLRQLVRLLSLLAPAVAATAVVGWALAGDGLLHTAASCSAIGLIWSGYTVLVPSLRRVVVTELWAKVAGRTT